MKLLMEQWKKFINEEKTEERPSPEAIQSKVPFFLENPESIGKVGREFQRLPMRYGLLRRATR